MGELPAELLEAADTTGYWDRADRGNALADLLEAAVGLIDRAAEETSELGAWLAERGLSVGQVLDMQVDVALEGRLDSPKCRRHLRSLFLAGLSPEQIARVFEVPVERVRAYTDQYSPGAATVLRLHRQGFTPRQIAAAIGVPRQTCTSIILGTEQRPHTERQVLPPEVRRDVLASASRGQRPVDIERTFGLLPYQVQNVLRSARRAGQL